MARYTGPKARVSRRLRHEHLRGTKGETIALERRPYPPGEHGRSRRRATVGVPVQLQEKQKARFTYGLSSASSATSTRRPTGSRASPARTAALLELRLDNVVYRAGWAATRPQARQFVGHGHVNVNGKRVDIPSYRSARATWSRCGAKAREMIVVRHNVDVLDRQPPGVARDRRGRAPGHRPRAPAARAHRRARARAAHRRALLQVTARPVRTSTSAADRQEEPAPCWSSSAPPSRPLGEDEGNRQRFAVGPLEPGFGHTLGNSLRRTLLSSIPGAAVTQVRFDDALHEFDTIAGVTEDVTDIILNLKDLVLVSDSDEPVTLRLDVRGPADVTAADIQTDRRDRDPQHATCTLATLNGKGRLAVDITVEQGRGYRLGRRATRPRPPSASSRSTRSSRPCGG